MLVRRSTSRKCLLITALFLHNPQRVQHAFLCKDHSLWWHGTAWNRANRAALIYMVKMSKFTPARGIGRAGQLTHPSFHFFGLARYTLGAHLSFKGLSGP